ncbi:MAG: hypothetical protein KDI79_07380, partial [Anaerolineae bacterium]|nr:hypothetical protein [Anaerolineae bacterium]
MPSNASDDIKTPIPDFDDILTRLRRQYDALELQQAKLGTAALPELQFKLEDCQTAIELTEQAHEGTLGEVEWRDQIKPLLVKVEAYDILALIQPRTEQTATGEGIAQVIGSGTATVTIHHHNYPSSPLAKTGRCDHYAHINLPPHFVPRPELLTSIKQTLLKGHQDVALTSAIKMSALHGMGGIGKSVLARSLCEESEVQEMFKDGILWTTLGQEVREDEIKAKLRVWIEALGGLINVTAPTLDQLKNSLAEQLKERACLLIVDDMWHYPDAAWFNAGGADCRLLLTTRDAESARQLGAAIAPISTMQEAEAISLLSQWARQPLQQSHPEPAAQIVKRLGYLPLALKLAGEQLRRKDPVYWLVGFSAQKLKSRRDESVHGNLFDTFALSLAELTAEEQQLYNSLIIFKKDEPIRLSVIKMLWSQLSNYEAEDSEELLLDLADRALLQLNEKNQMVTLHDLVRDFMAEQLPVERRQQAHTRLLAYYRTTQTGHGWASAPDDGYLYNHLTYHLDALANHNKFAVQELHQLFADDAWLQVRITTDDFRYDGYLADLELAWQQAEQTARLQIEVEQPLTAIIEIVRCALIESTINTMINQYDLVLIPRAVEVGLWSLEQAISVAAKIGDPKKRAELCIALLVFDSTIAHQHHRLRRIGLAAVRAIDDEWGLSRAKALSGLVPHLSGAQLGEALTAART